MVIPLRNSWQWVVTDLGGATTTYLRRIATNKAIAYALNDSAVFTCDVPSDQRDVNLRGADNNPYVAHNTRLLYGLRREGGDPPYSCRYSGVVTIVEDEGSDDEPVTHVTAHDPWMWARSLPVLDGGGNLPGQRGLVYVGKTADFIAKDLIANAYAWMVATYGATSPWSGLPNDGHHYFIDIDSGHYDGDYVDSITFTQGTSVGDAWTQLTKTGTCDIVLAPIYKPHDQPGVLAVLNVYAQAGAQKPGAVFGYDAFPHSALGISRLIDGTQLENYAQYYSGGLAVTPQVDTPSIDAHGPYWTQKSYTSPSSSPAVELVAAAELALRKQGKWTITVDPTPERSPDPFTEYFLGDQVPLWGGVPTLGVGYTTRVRFSAGEPDGSGGWTNPHRVYAIPITLADDETETVTQLLLADPNA
jgi:hypothetical protein